VFKELKQDCLLI